MNDKKFGRYELMKELGRGGMATVYLANDPMFDREVAIKVLPREFLHDPMFKTRFNREAKTVAALEHPAIVPVYDFGEEDGQPFLVMRYMPGGTLADRIKNRKLSLEEIDQIIKGIAPALDLAHSQGIIHRDLKPANILFDNAGNPYLSDFGIVKISQATAVTGSVIIGTPAYMSPEQAQAKAEIDGRSDMYSLGVVIFEMITGRMPYEADSPIGMALMHISEPVPNIREFTPEIPAETQDVLKRAMAKDTSERYPTAEELAQAISGIVKKSAPIPIKEDTKIVPDDVKTLIEAQAVPVPETDKLATLDTRTKRQIPRAKLIRIGIAGVGLITLSVFAAWYFGFRSNPAATTETPIAQSGMAEETTVPTTDAVPTINTAQTFPTNESTEAATQIEPTISPTSVPEATESPSIEMVTPRAISIENLFEITRLRTIHEEVFVTYVLAFSPDNNLLASSVGANGVNIWDVNDGSLVMNLDVHESRVTCLDFSPDGRLLATGSWDRTVKLWQVSDWSEVQILTGHTSFLRDCEFSPDSNLLVSGGADNRVIVFNASDGSILHQFPPLSLSVQNVKFSTDGSLIAATAGITRVNVWRTDTGVLYRHLEGQSNIYGLAFSPDGSVVAGGSATAEGPWFGSDPVARITFWDLETGDIIVSGSEMTIALELIYSQDGSLLFSNRGYAISCWRSTDGELVHELSSNGNEFHALVTSDDGSLLATKSSDGEILIWGLPQE